MVNIGSTQLLLPGGLPKDLYSASAGFWVAEVGGSSVLLFLWFFPFLLCRLCMIRKLSEGFGIRSRDQISWCDCYGRLSSSVTQKPLTSILDVEKGIAKLSAEDVFFSDQEYC